MEITIIYIQLLLLLITAIECQIFYQVGIYSNCTGKANRTQLNIDAGLVGDFNGDIVHQMRDYLQLKYSMNYTHDFVYEVYDVCDDITHPNS